MTTGKEGTFPLLLTAQPSKPHTAVNVQDTASKDLLNGRGAWRVYSRSTIISLVFKKNHNACCVENRLKGTGRLLRGCCRNGGSEGGLDEGGGRGEEET